MTAGLPWAQRVGVNALLTLAPPAVLLFAILLSHALLADRALAQAVDIVLALRTLCLGGALTIGAVMLARYVGQRDPASLILAMAFLGAGLVHAGHVIALFGLLGGDAASDVATTWLPRAAWAAGGALPTLLMLGAAWLPPAQTVKGGGWPRRMTAMLSMAAVLVAAGLIGPLIDGFPGASVAGSVVARPPTTWVMVAYLLAMVVVWRRPDLKGVGGGSTLSIALFIGLLGHGIAAPFWHRSSDGLAVLEAATMLLMYLTLVTGMLISTSAAARAEGVATRLLHAEVEERHRVERALARQAARLMRANEELGQFAYVASHDLQEPLRMVSSYLQLIERRYDGVLDAEGREFMRYAVDGAARMKRLTNDLLSYSRVTTRGKEPALVPAATAFDEALLDLQVAIAESGAQVSRAELPEVWADPGQLTQLYQNLIGNAVKFHRPGTPPTIHADASAQADDWLFHLRDNGIGIDPQYFERIFGVFQRLHGVGSYPGSGIGLAICRKIVERHGGRIWVEASDEAGTTIAWTLPINPRQLRETEPDTVSAQEDMELQGRISDIIERARELI